MNNFTVASVDNIDILQWHLVVFYGVKVVAGMVQPLPDKNQVLESMMHNSGSVQWCSGFRGLQNPLSKKKK